jgi:ABC-type sugar transport system ATPase subunit
MLGKENSDFKEGENEMLCFCDRIYVLDNGNLRKQILGEAHKADMLFALEK